MIVRIRILSGIDSGSRARKILIAFMGLASKMDCCFVCRRLGVQGSKEMSILQFAKKLNIWESAFLQYAVVAPVCFSLYGICVTQQTAWQIAHARVVDRKHIVMSKTASKYIDACAMLTGIVDWDSSNRMQLTEVE
jgi:hypothetical protein